jgi:hypothetical protein
VTRCALIRRPCASQAKQLLAHRSREVFGSTSWHLEGLQVMGGSRFPVLALCCAFPSCVGRINSFRYV